MEQVIKEIWSRSNQYKVQIIKRKDGFFSTVAYLWVEEDGYEYWNPIKKGLSLIETEESAVALAIEHLREYSGENSCL
ncbi:hypothetical protein ACFPRA_03620 [Sporosarcina soli]|uniref:Phage protein n=1 Tax=Sporosarcina soli TaxID=334736 RepID=A0ABW0TEZ2_9BACL